MESIDFGKYLKSLRKGKKLTVRQLDLYSGVSHSYISQMEAGKRGIPTPDILNKLSKPLGVEYGDLMKVAGYIKEELKDEKQKAAEKLVELVELDLTNEEIRNQMGYKLKVDNMILSDSELDEFIDFVRVKRLMRKQQHNSLESEGLLRGQD